MPDEVKTWKELFDISAPVSTRLVNDVTCYHENESIQALALLGAVRAALEPFTRLPAAASAPALYHHITLTGPELQALRDLAEQVCGAE